MLKLSAVLVLLACCTAYAASERSLTQAIATGSVTSTGGKAKVNVISKAAASSETVKSEIVVFCKKLVNQYVFPVYQGNRKGYCLAAYSMISADLKAVGKAIAEAYAKTVVEVSVQGSGQACGSGEAQAQAHAEAVAKIFFEALAVATNKYDQADIAAEIKITIKALAFAYADAWAKACVGNNSYGKVVQETYARASVKVIATLCVWLFAKVDCTGYSGYVEGEADAENKQDADTFASSSTLAEVYGTGVVAGGGIAVSEAIPKCTGIYARCCNKMYSKSLSCYCYDNYYADRCYAKKEKRSSRIWLYSVNGEPTSCYC